MSADPDTEYQYWTSRAPWTPSPRRDHSRPIGDTDKHLWINCPASVTDDQAQVMLTGLERRIDAGRPVGMVTSYKCASGNMNWAESATDPSRDMRWDVGLRWIAACHGVSVDRVRLIGESYAIVSPDGSEMVYAGPAPK